MSQSLTPKLIEDQILQNFVEYQDSFIQFQSNFFTGLYKRYQGLENGCLVLYFARQIHQQILRKKDYDLNFNIGLEKFWENHELVSPRKKSIIKIASSISLPKETARRKILQLMKQKVLSKKNKNIGWFPNKQYKESYNLIIEREIKDLSSLLIYICKKLNISIPKETAEKELKENFNFYWFHFTSTQIEYLKIWGAQIKDLELVLISLQIISIFASRAGKKNLSHKKIYNDPSVIKDFNSASINATSVSEVTGIPRATCVRKLSDLVKLKMIGQDTFSKRYYLLPTSISENLISKEVTLKITKTFSEFYFICLRGITSKFLS
jgi:hypothetical protein